MKSLENITSIDQLKEEYGDKLPVHLGVILDGNRRWIKRKSIKDSFKGHEVGYNTLKKIIYASYDIGIKYLTIYALSTDNVAKRSKREINYLFELLLKGIEDVFEEPLTFEKEVKIQVFGRTEDLPQEFQKKVKQVQESTKNHNKCFLNMCIIYDGQEEIVDAVKKIIRKGIPPDTISKEIIKQNLYTHNIPEADYIIRTGMEDGARISGFLLWDSSYAEFRFRKELWPDYNEEMLIEDLKEYIKRNRRKGA